MKKVSSKVGWKGGVVLGVMIALFDQITKLLTHLYLPLMSQAQPLYPYGGTGVFKNFFGIEFSISHTVNTGAAWGAFSDQQLPLIAFRIALIFGMTLYLLFWNKHPEQHLPIVLVITGAASNVFDTLVYGHVVDMLHFVLWGYDYPVFNIADTTIFVGVAWLLILSFQKEDSLRSES